MGGLFWVQGDEKARAADPSAPFGRSGWQSVWWCVLLCRSRL